MDIINKMKNKKCDLKNKFNNNVNTLNLNDIINKRR